MEIPVEDEVLRELDVYLTDFDELYLLQFPLKPFYTDPPIFNEGKFKPVHKILELKSGLHTFKSTKLSDIGKSNIAFGVIHNDELHISEIQDVFQMRPSFANLKPHNSMDDFIVQDDDVEEADNNSVTIDQSLEKVSLKVNNESSQYFRKKSYAFAKSKEDNEKWNNIKIHGFGDNESEIETNKLFYS
jgi:hypothetical protein